MNKVKLGKKQLLYYSFMKCFRIFPIDRKKIVVSNFRGKGYGDNPKYIIENLRKRKETYKIYWLVEDKNEKMPEEIHVVKINSIASLYHLSTAKIWIDNCRKSPYITKRKKQYYIQTWHGAIGFKKIEKEAPGLTEEYRLASLNDSKMIDILLSGSQWCTEMLQRSFWYCGKVLEVGSPRNDIFFLDNDELKLCIRKKINLSNEFIIMYAPTFRQTISFDVFNNNYEKWISAFEKKTGRKCKLLFRLHPNIASLYKNIQIGENIINVSDYPDMQELLLITDALITDYSSSAFEAALGYKPVFLLCNDYYEFITQERELFFNMEELPFEFAINEDELFHKIAEFKYEEYIENVNAFYAKIGSFENGKASEKVAEIIENVCKMQ